MFYKGFDITIKQLSPKRLYSSFKTKTYTWISCLFSNEKDAEQAAKTEIDKMLEKTNFRF